jgi:hypothetical protein
MGQGAMLADGDDSSALPNSAKHSHTPRGNNCRNTIAANPSEAPRMYDDVMFPSIFANAKNFDLLSPLASIIAFNLIKH